MPASLASGIVYYVSSPLLHGQAGRAGSVRRVPGRGRGSPRNCRPQHLEDSTQTDDRELISTHVIRVEVHADQLAAS